MQSKKAKGVLETLFTTNGTVLLDLRGERVEGSGILTFSFNCFPSLDRAGLYFLAFAMTFFNEVPEVLWPYRETTMESILGVCFPVLFH